MGVVAFLRVDGAKTLAAEEAEVLTATEVTEVAEVAEAAEAAEASEIFRGIFNLLTQGR